MSRTVHLFLTVAVSCLGLAISREVRAADPTKQECNDAHTKAQDLMHDGKLLSSRGALAICGSASCPSIIRDDCTTLRTEVEAAMPSVVFDVKNGAGADLRVVRVTMHGQPFTAPLDGKGVDIDPGEHTLVFEVEGQPALEKTVVIREGEKGRTEHIVLGNAPPASPSAPAAAGSGLGTQKVFALVAAGAGVVGLGLGATFGIIATSQKSAAQSACPGSQCTTQDGVNKWSTAGSTGNVSTVGFIVGGIAVAGAAVLWFTAPSSTGASTQVGLGLGSVQVKGTW